MANKTRQIVIESILGGQSKYVNYAAADEFLHSYNIDPDLSSGFTQSAGIISPSGVVNVPPGDTLHTPKWIITQPKPNVNFAAQPSIFVYDAAGSVFKTVPDDISLVYGVSGGDLNDGGTASGNGAAYYDNYAYFARDTTIARLGPLDGTLAFTDDYWSSTLGKTPLTNTNYPVYTTSGTNIPNHVMHRHTDGKLYIADVVGNQGVLHTISTKKTTVEGDTDDGSTYNALDFPYGMWPTALATYNSNLAIALYEGTPEATNTMSQRAKLSFWDTTSANYSQITSVEFPDPVIYALLNSNGVLYVFSGQINKTGVRVTRFAGGYTFEQVAYIDHSYPPMAGAVDGYLNRVLFAGKTTEPNSRVYDIATTTTSQIPNNSFMRGCVWAIGSKKSPVSLSLFNIMGTSNTASSTIITALKIGGQAGMDVIKPFTGWTNEVTAGLDTTVLTASASRNPLDLGGGTLSLSNTSYGPPSLWRSQVYRIGQKFKITKISIPFDQRFDFGTGDAGLTVGVLRDGADPQSNYVRVGDFVGAAEYKNRLVIRPESLVCEYRFILELVFTSDPNNPYPRVALPITIEYELIDD